MRDTTHARMHAWTADLVAEAGEGAAHGGRDVGWKFAPAMCRLSWCGEGARHSLPSVDEGDDAALEGLLTMAVHLWIIIHGVVHGYDHGSKGLCRNNRC